MTSLDECKRLADKDCPICDGDGWYMDYDGEDGHILTKLICECVAEKIKKEDA